MEYFMKKKHNFQLKSKHILAIMTIVCISLLMITFASDFSVQPLRNGVSYVVVPFEKGINQVGNWLNDFADNFRDAKKIAKENEKLQEELATLKEENHQLTLNQEELSRFESLYETDQSYNQYEKVFAQIIAREPGNWYHSFTIDKGSDDGLQVDMNVISSGGLVGIVTQVGSGWATVRSLIDDGMNISAMTVSDSNTCVVSGDLELMDSGRIRFSQLIDDTGSVAAGQNLVTSHISDKYLEGILIGTISSIERDSNNLTSTGELVPAVDFRNLQEVLVIKQLKEQPQEE